MNPNVCAVVVTYNRKALLHECLQALLAQTTPVSQILVIDNASTDGTPEMLENEFPEKGGQALRVHLLAQNTGGAGGFFLGMKMAAEAGFDWIWLLDDDTIVELGALTELLAARQRFDFQQRPDLLASKVVWTDGSMHPMNVPRVKRGDRLESLCLAAEYATISIRSASFVSLLLHRRHVEQYGLPIADYFIWNDDVEYTARILRSEFGVLVPQSIVVHKTAQKHAEPSPRFYFAVRNHIWMVLRSASWSGEEKIKNLGSLALSIGTYFKETGFRAFALRAVVKGLVYGLFSAPKPNP